MYFIERLYLLDSTLAWSGPPPTVSAHLYTWEFIVFFLFLTGLGLTIGSWVKRKTNLFFSALKNTKIDTEDFLKGKAFCTNNKQGHSSLWWMSSHPAPG